MLSHDLQRNRGPSKPEHTTKVTCPISFTSLVFPFSDNSNDAQLEFEAKPSQTA
jgi:hypothetical protein